MVSIIWDLPLPYAPTKTRARSVDVLLVLNKMSSRSSRADLVGIKFLSLSSLVKSYPMLEPRSNGKPDTMLYEMNDALESMIFRWNFCRSNYAAFFGIEECREEIKKLIRSGCEFLKQYEGGLCHYDDTCSPV